MKVDFKINIGEQNKKEVCKAFERYCATTFQPIKPKFYLVTGLNVSTGTLQGVFLNEKEGTKVLNFTRKILNKARAK